VIIYYSHCDIKKENSFKFIKKKNIYQAFFFFFSTQNFLNKGFYVRPKNHTRYDGNIVNKIYVIKHFLTGKILPILNKFECSYYYYSYHCPM